MNLSEPLGRTRPAPSALRRDGWAARLALVARSVPRSVPWLALLLLPPMAPLQAAEAALSLAEAVQLATARSQRVVATRWQAQAARESAVAAAQRPDPVLKVGVNNLPIDGSDQFNLTTDFMTMRSFSVMQELTRSGKLEARAQRAQLEADAALVAQRQVVAELQRDTALAWLERSYQQTLLELLQAQVREAELQVQAAQTLLGSGRASQADVFAARSQLEQLRDAATQTERSIAVATTQLARWIGVAAQRRSAARPTMTAPAWTASHDLGVHLARHPQLAAAAQQEAMAQADTAIARAEEETDWSVELMFSQRGPSYSNMVSFNVSLPLQWNRAQRQGREVAARQAQAARSAAEREDMQRAYEAEVRSMLVQWRNHEQRLQRFDSNLLPLAKQRSSAALTSYRSGAGPLAAVLDARRAEVELRSERLRIELDVARLWAQLAYLDPQLAADSTRPTP